MGSVIEQERRCLPLLDVPKNRFSATLVSRAELNKKSLRLDRFGELAATSVKKDPVEILIVDDHSVVRRGLCSWLRSLDQFEIVGEAATAEEAVNKAAQLQPDLVLLDVTLDDEGGITAAHQIRRTCRNAEILAFSASADPVHIRGMLATGAKGYVLKSSDNCVLLAAIHSVLRQRRFLDPALSDALIEELSLFPEPTRRTSAMTAREKQVLTLMACGHTNQEIAETLLIKATSVNTYKMRFCAKLGLTSKPELIRYALATGLMADGSCRECPRVSHPGSNQWQLRFADNAI